MMEIYVVTAIMGLLLLVKEQYAYSKLMALVLIIGGLIGLDNENIDQWNIGVIGRGVVMIAGGMWLMVVGREGRLIGLSTLGVGEMLVANDLITLYIALELQSLGAYALAGRSKRMRGVEAGIRYWVVGGVASGIFLYGGAMVYENTGATEINICESVEGMNILIIGLLIKVAAAPFHMWAPEVYEGAPTRAAGFYAIVPKIGLIGALIKLATMVDLIVISSLIVGTIGGLYQRSIKRLLVYSGISHVGYMLMGYTVAEAIWIYMMIYVILTINVWVLVKNINCEHIYEISTRKNGYERLSVILNVLAMAGIPPLLGFYGKLGVLLAAIKGGSYIIAIVGITTSVIGGFYYLRWIGYAISNNNIKGGILKRDSVVGWIVSMTTVTGVMGFMAF